MQAAHRGVHRRCTRRGAGGGVREGDTGDGHLEPHAAVPAPEHLGDELDVVLVVAAVPAVATSRSREAVSGLPHPQRCRRHAGALGQVADGQGARLDGGLRGEGFVGSLCDRKPKQAVEKSV